MAAGAEKPKPFKLARQVAKARRLALLDAATARPISEVVAASQRIVAARADPAVSLGLGATLRTQQLDSEIAALALERTERGRADGRTGGLEIHEYFLRHFDDTLLAVNNIEVIYNHVILVLKGVSLSVPKGLQCSAESWIFSYS